MTKRGNPLLNKNADQRRNRTCNLIREAAKLLDETFEIKSPKKHAS